MEDRIYRPQTDEDLERNLLTTLDLFVPPCEGPIPCDNWDNLDRRELWWNDLNKIDIPQADEQQRLLANLIGFMNRGDKPLPRLWYLPSYYDGPLTEPIVQKAAIVMTGDDHAGGEESGTVKRFDIHHLEEQKSGNKPVRSTSYIVCFNGELATCDVGIIPTEEELAPHLARGFELGLHPVREVGGMPPPYEAFYGSQLEAWRDWYTSAPTPSTNRTDGVEWYDYDGQPQVEFDHSIRFDTNYYYWVEVWKFQTTPPFRYPGLHPGHFTGSALPMRLATRDGELIDVYQAVTQMTDHSQQCYYNLPNEPPETCTRYGRDDLPNTIDHLLKAAFDSRGYYGVFTANAHTDDNVPCEFDPPDTRHGHLCTSLSIIARARAQEYQVPVFSSREMLEWLDGRNGSAFRKIRWKTNGPEYRLEFDIAAAVGAEHTQAMLPTCSGNGLPLLAVTRPGTGDLILGPPELIKGVEYAFFWAEAGSYTATYGPGSCSGSASQQSAISPGISPSDLATVWSAAEAFDVPATSEIIAPPSSYSEPSAGLTAAPPSVVTPPTVSLASGAGAVAEATDSAVLSIPTEPPAFLLDVLFAGVVTAPLMDDPSAEIVTPVF